MHSLTQHNLEKGLFRLLHYRFTLSFLSHLYISICCRSQKRWGKTGRRGWRPEQGKNAQVAAGRSPFTSEQACCLHWGCNRRPSGLNLHSQGGPATRDICRQQVSGRSLWLRERTCLFDAVSLFNLPKRESKLSSPRFVAVRVITDWGNTCIVFYFSYRSLFNYASLRAN